MAATEGTAAYGVTLGYATTSGGSATLITDITEITPVGETVNTVEMTHHGSPAGYSEHIATIKDAEGFEFKGNLVHGASENRAVLRGLLGSRKFWVVNFAGGAKCEIDGFLSELSYDAQGTKDKQGISGKITRASGAPLWTEAS